jgi:hypothetical protein
MERVGVVRMRPPCLACAAAPDHIGLQNGPIRRRAERYVKGSRPATVLIRGGGVRHGNFELQNDEDMGASSTAGYDWK